MHVHMLSYPSLDCAVSEAREIKETLPNQSSHLPHQSPVSQRVVLSLGTESWACAE